MIAARWKDHMRQREVVREGRKTGREGRNGRERKSGVKSSERERER